MKAIPFPKVSESQNINEQAKAIFKSQKPSSWFIIDTDGDNDFGLDFLVQFKDENNLMKYSFFLQLKGVESKSKINDKEIKLQIKSSTLNYYRNNGLVILVVCDVIEQKCYYEFMHIILNKLNENNRYLDNSQTTYLLKVQKEQILNKELNIENILESYAQWNYDKHRKLTILNEYNIEDFFEDNEEDYPYKRDIYNNHYTHQKGRVYINAFIPYNFDFDMSCLITFKLSDAKNALITPNTKTVLEVLFSGYKSKANSSSRKWIVANYNNDFIIQIGNTRLTVPSQTIIDLSDIFDDLFYVYTSRIKEFESKLESRSFPISKTYIEGFQMIKIKRGLWYYIHKFAEKHRFNDNNSEWGIFGYDNYYLRINFKKRHSLWSGNIIIAPERYDGYLGFTYADDEVIL
ncbi:MAG: DUF4365 domain-containing protein [Sulfurimonas sp.]